MQIKPNPLSVASNPDFKVRDPITKIWLPEEGMTVPDHDGYWNRRLRDGDVVIVTEEAPAKLSTPKKGDIK